MQAGIRYSTLQKLFLASFVGVLLFSSFSTVVLADDGPGNPIGPNVAGGRDDPYGSYPVPNDGYAPAAPNYGPQPAQPAAPSGLILNNYVGPELPLTQSYAGFASQGTSYLSYGTYTATQDNPITIYSEDGRTVVTTVDHGQVRILRDNGTRSNFVLVDHFGNTQQSSPQNYGQNSNDGFPNMQPYVSGTNLWNGNQTWWN